MLSGARLTLRRGQKYHNRAVLVDGERFASQLEADRWRALRLLERAGEIRALRRQVTFPLQAGGRLICRYVADFAYEVPVPGFADYVGSPQYRPYGWREVVEDAKGCRTELYRLKKRLMSVLLGIDVLETSAADAKVRARR